MLIRRSSGPLFAAIAALFILACAWTLGSPIDARAQAAPQSTPAPQGDSVPDFLRWYEAQRPVQLAVPSNGAVVLIVKFTDLECPACALTYEAYKPVLAKYEGQFPGAVRLVTKDYPLNQACNPQLPRSIHESACDAAIAVRLARRAGRGPELEDFLYANQRVMTPETVRRAASLVGNVDAAAFDASRAAVLKEIQADVALGRSIGVNSTPTFVINGILVPKVMYPTQFDAVIQYELKKAGKVR